MTMKDNLQAVLNFVGNMLFATEETKKRLQTEVDEARFVLKPWRIDSLPQETDKICNCADCAAEISNEISQNLLHDQQLKEKLILNVNKERREANRPSLREIYTSKKNQPAKRDTSARKRSVSQHRIENKPLALSKARSSSTTRLAPKPLPTNDGSQKNFILANKLSLKILSASNGNRRIDNNSRESSASLENVTRKVSEVSLKSNGRCIKDKNSEFRATTTVDVIEGLDRVGVPSNMLKPLKVYHNYLKNNVLKDTSPEKPKSNDAVQSFMDAVHGLGKKRRESYPKVVEEIFDDYVSVCLNSLEHPMSSEKINKLIKNYQDLDKRCKSSNLPNKSHDQIKIRDSKSCFEIDNARNYLSFGIWNNLHIEDLTMMLVGAHSIRYSDRRQLIRFYTLQQEVQRGLYLLDLMDLLAQTIIPHLKFLPDSDGKDFVDVYKMICTAMHVINLKVPILVSTEDEED